MTLDEIKAYASAMLELAKVDGPNEGELRTRIVQQVVAVRGIPLSDEEQRVAEMRRGAGPMPIDRSKH